MRQRKAAIWKEYLSSVAIAYGVAAMFTLLMPMSFGQGKILPLLTRLEIGLLSGTFFGNAFFVVGYVRPKVKYPSFLLTCFVNSLVICLVMLVGLFVIIPVTMGILSDPARAPWDPKVLALFRQAVPTAVLLEWTLVGLAISMVINAAHQINRYLGPGVAVNWMTGKYHTPREEERIFMFLDLKNSTMLAERLGNLLFSSLCQDFFADLSGPILATKGSVSHYIGDEAVLTWKPDRGLDKANCLRCFFLMQEAIAKRAEHYAAKYGILPEFKAGVHIGQVVAAAVGEIKSEIVFHGDVLNTTARITGLCAEMNCDLLISGDLLARLPSLPDGAGAQSYGMRLLKGKEHEVEIVAVRPVEPPAPDGLDTPDRATADLTAK